MEKDTMVRMVEGGCPFAKRSGLRVTEAGGGRVTATLEANESNLNAFGLVHAGALCGLAETAGGMAIFNFLDPREFIVLNTILNIRFTSMPRGELVCTARASEDEVKSLVAEAGEGGRADKAMDLKVFDSGGKMFAQAQASFRLMPTPEEFKSYMS